MPLKFVNHKWDSKGKIVTTKMVRSPAPNRLRGSYHPKSPSPDLEEGSSQKRSPRPLSRGDSTQVKVPKRRLTISPSMEHSKRTKTHHTSDLSSFLIQEEECDI